jgi:phosphoribosylanthranilate isomerase
MLRLNQGEQLPPMSASPAYLILSEEDSVSKFVPDHDLLLAVGNVDELKKALVHTGISGVCLQGGTEIRPGLKTYDELGEILEALDVDG